MGRQTAWVLALLITCVPGDLCRTPGATGPPGGGADAGRDSKDNKDNKDKAQNGPKPEDRERWKWWLRPGGAGHQRPAVGRDQPDFRVHHPEIARDSSGTRQGGRGAFPAIKEHKADIAVVSGQLDRVESARSQYNKMRVLMLYRMHLLLSPDQRASSRRSAPGTTRAAGIATRRRDTAVIRKSSSSLLFRMTSRSQHLEAFVRKTPTFWATWRSRWQFRRSRRSPRRIT